MNKKPFIILPIYLSSILAMTPINFFSKEVDPWMSKVNDNTRLIDLSIPGTHDSGATHSIFDVAGKCQDLNISEQLRIGVRFFDLRIQLVNNDLNIVHGPVDQNLKFNTVLTKMKDFIKKHPSEFIIISLKKEADDVNSTLDFSETLVERINNQTDIISLAASLPTNVGEARGKIHIISRANINVGLPAYYGWRDDTTFTLDNMYIQDNYCIDDVNEKINDIKATVDVSNHQTNDKLVLNFLSCYLDNSFPPSYAGTPANTINPWFNSYIKENDNYKLGIVLCDFISEELAMNIYRRNY